jgi:hypothetical protein
MNENLSNLKVDVLKSGEEDCVGLWMLASFIKEDFSFQDGQEAKDFILQFIFELLVNDLFQVGELTKQGGFKSWEGSPEELVQRIKREWKDGADEMCIWFNITEKGKQELARLLAGRDKQDKK